MNRERALKALRGEPADRIPHWEHFANPNFEEAVTGVDPYLHPRLARARLLEALPMDVGNVPTDDTPIERPPEGQDVLVDAEGRLAVRWGTGASWHWDWGRRFRTIEDVLRYEPLLDMDQRHADVVADYDYSLSVDELARQFQADLDAKRALTGDRALVSAGYYNTLFMWPLLTFGWELFLELGAVHRDALRRLLADFAVRSRKICQAWAKTDVEVITSHDDICHRNGPTFSPKWLREFIYPYYEELWSYLHAGGVKVIFISDGNVDRVADDVVACGADGIMSEPYTDWPTLARRFPDKILVGDGDNRVLMSDDRAAIFSMVERMCELGKSHPAYFLSLGNLLPHHLSIESVNAYFEASEKFGRR
jgi:Uroporphyrinogen decarboxylase (URO-D)